MTYQEAVHFLYSLGNELHTAKLGLERISKLLSALGNPHRAGRFVHVAGTNGKGSTSAMIESGLRHAGMTTGLYTSPHLCEPTERIRINGAAVSTVQFAAAFEEVHETAERMLKAGELDLHPTYFECVTAMAFLLFREAALDMVVMEVGLGGRLDATNVITPELCVITPIEFDHQSFLGDTLEEIAAEKAGILKPGIPAVFAPQYPHVETVLQAHASGVTTRTVDWPITELDLTPRGSRFRTRHLEVTCPLAGEHQVENARAAAISLHLLGVRPDGIAYTEWPGRLQRLSEHPEIIVDGAHNPAGTRALAAYMERFYMGRTVWLIYGVMRDKAVEPMTGLLFPLAKHIILTAPKNSRALAPEKIRAPGALIAQDVGEALALAKQAAPEDVVLITGSLFLVGEALGLLVQ